MERKKAYSRTSSYDDDEGDDGDSDDDVREVRSGTKQAGEGAPTASTSSLTLRSSSSAIRSQQPHEPPPAKLREQLCNFLLCPLCQGYLIDATIASECGHAFCKSCITTYISNAKPQQKCPVCDAVLNPEYPELPLKGLRADHRRQRIVFKLVPGLFEEELRQRVQFTGATGPEARDKVFGETMGKLIQQGGSFYSIDEYCNAILKPAVATSGKDSSSASVTAEGILPTGSATPLREVYIMTQLKTDVKSLKKFIQLKFHLDQWRTVHIDVCNNGVLEGKARLPSSPKSPITDEMTLHEIAYEIKWNRAHPMRLTFQLLNNAVGTSASAKAIQINSSSVGDESGDHSTSTASLQRRTLSKDTGEGSESPSSTPANHPPQTPPEASVMQRNAVATTNAAGNTIIRMPPPLPATKVPGIRGRKPRISNTASKALSSQQVGGGASPSPANSGSPAGNVSQQRPVSAGDASVRAAPEKGGADTDDERIIVVDDEEEARISPIRISQLMKRHHATVMSGGDGEKPQNHQQVLASECLKQASLACSKRLLPTASSNLESGIVSPAASTKKTKLDNSNVRSAGGSPATQSKPSLNLVINLNAYPNVTGAGNSSSSSKTPDGNTAGAGKSDRVETASVIVSSSSSSLTSNNIDNGEKLTVKLRKVDGGVWLPSAGEKRQPTTVKARKLIIRNSAAQIAANKQMPNQPIPSDRPPVISSVAQQQTAAQKLRLQTPPTSVMSPVQSQKQHPTALHISTTSSTSRTTNTNNATAGSSASSKGQNEMPSVTLTPTDNFRHSDSLLLRMQPPASSQTAQNLSSSSVRPRLQPNPNSFFLSAPPKNGHGFPDVMNRPPPPTIAGDFVKFSNNSNYLNYNMMNNSIGSSSGGGGMFDAAVAAHRSGQMILPPSVTTPTLFQQYNYPQQQSLPPSLPSIVQHQQPHRFFRSPNPLVATLSPSSSLTDDAVDDTYQNAVLRHASPSPASSFATIAPAAEATNSNMPPADYYSTTPHSSSSSVHSAFTLLNAFRAGCLSMASSSNNAVAGVSNNLNSNISMPNYQQNYFSAGSSPSLCGTQSSHDAMAAAGAAVAVAAFAAAAVSAVAAANSNSGSAAYLASQQNQHHVQSSSSLVNTGAAATSKRRKVTKSAGPLANDAYSRVVPKTIERAQFSAVEQSVKPESSAVVVESMPKPILNTNNGLATTGSSSNKFFAAKAVGLERVISRISSSNCGASATPGNNSSMLQ